MSLAAQPKLVGEGKRRGPVLPTSVRPSVAIAKHGDGTLRVREPPAKSYRIVGERDLSVSAKDLFFGDIRRDRAQLLRSGVEGGSARAAARSADFDCGFSCPIAGLLAPQIFACVPMTADAARAVQATRRCRRRRQRCRPPDDSRWARRCRSRSLISDHRHAAASSPHFPFPALRRRRPRVRRINRTPRDDADDNGDDQQQQHDIKTSEKARCDRGSSGSKTPGAHRVVRHLPRGRTRTATVSTRNTPPRQPQWADDPLLPASARTRKVRHPL